MWEGIGDRTKTATYWPPNTSGYHKLSFLFSWTAQQESSAGTWFAIQHLLSNDLNFLSPGLYNNWTSTYFLQVSLFRTQFNASTVKVAPDLISSTGCTCYLRWCISFFFFFFWQLGTVGGQYATQIELNCILILNSVVWNITVFTFKQYTFVKLNCSEKNWKYV